MPRLFLKLQADKMIEPAAISSCWQEIVDVNVWDRMLAGLNGHPLQSARWGEARRRVDGYDSHYLTCMQDRRPLLLARVETRKFSLLGKVAWVPRGPVLAEGVAYPGLAGGFHDLLRQLGFSLVVTDLYEQASINSPDSGIHTIWIDLSAGIDAIQKRIDKQWMYGTRRAVREGVKVICASSSEDVSEFYHMCSDISQSKGFQLPGSEALMKLLQHAFHADDQGMYLFLAKYEGRIAGGAFVARSGSHVHYLWGATDRELSRQRVGEAVQWAVIEWAVSKGCVRYDLEGIDPVNNPGVYAFKKKMGGVEVVLCGKSSHALNLRGKLIAFVGRWSGRI